jgi:hypothetical protein
MSFDPTNPVDASQIVAGIAQSIHRAQALIETQRSLN